ncbi:hypothetical protein HMPREF9445_02753 [Bacteroides clarus YIT 12056]|uniref:Uncharacterized protein n=1 Tax=Bacteroides clarus YIT 12056 TaxID=762984 RepID=A0ABP2KNC9_9BACE|nr:hypothetical protein HMPREF9445_02753 [Bacteroides clarus YIT 12056]
MLQSNISGRYISILLTGFMKISVREYCSGHFFMENVVQT